MNVKDGPLPQRAVASFVLREVFPSFSTWLDTQEPYWLHRVFPFQSSQGTDERPFNMLRNTHKKNLSQHMLRSLAMLLHPCKPKNYFPC